MPDLKSLIEKLQAEGFKPTVNLSIPATTTDIEAIKVLHSQLQAAGIIPEIHINLGVSSGVSTQPDAGQDSTVEKSAAVVVSDDKLNCFIFKQRDDAEKPIFAIREPRIQLFRGDRFLVSADRRESDKDPGDGTIFGTGNIRMYYIVDCPSKPEAVGMYVKQSEVMLA